MQSFESVRRAPRRATPANGTVALWSFFNYRYKFPARHGHKCSCEHVTCLAFSEPQNAERPTLNIERSILFCIQRWTLDVRRWTLPAVPGRGGRAVDRAGLENRRAERPREFESHPLRHLIFNFRLPIIDSEQQEVRYNKRAQDSQKRCANDIRQVMRAQVHARDPDQNWNWQTPKTNPTAGDD